MKKETEAAEPHDDAVDMQKLSKALGVVKAKKAALDAANVEMARVTGEQQMHVNAAQSAYEESQRAAEALHAEFREMVSALLPGSTRTRTA